MTGFRPASAQSELEAAYSGMPDADPTVPLSRAITAVRAALYDLRNSADTKFRLGATEMEIDWAMVANGRPVLLQADFQAAFDHLESTGQADAAVCSRGTCYAITTTGYLHEEESRLPWWRKQARAVKGDLGRLLAATLVGSVITLAATSVWHHFFP